MKGLLIPRRKWPLVQEGLKRFRVDAPMRPRRLDHLLHGDDDEPGRVAAAPVPNQASKTNGAMSAPFMVTHP
jgi:hypothetical protein